MLDPCAPLVSLGSSCAELLGFVSGALCVWLVTRESIWNWPLGALTAACYVVVFARSGLYSDTGLQAVYLVLSFYGWWHWLRGERRGGEARSPLVVTRTPAREAALLAAAGVAMWLVFWQLTARIPGTRAPLLDSALVATSLVAQWMMTRKYRENWVLWIAVDVLYVGLYAWRGLALTAVLYAVYLALAVHGLRTWTRSLHRAVA
jgi:nicotinamide mononucleotide transporter